MSKNIFVSGSNTNVGKTFITLKLIQKFSELGYKVGVFKPIETGVETIPQDGLKLLNEVKKYRKVDFSIDDVVPIQLKLASAPFVAGEVDFNKIDEKYKKISENSDIVLIEGAGGLLVPVTENFKMIDFIDYFNAKLLLVIQSRLGCINDLELNLNLLKDRNFIWTINLFDDSFYEISYPYLKKYNPLIFQKDCDRIVKELT